MIDPDYKYPSLLRGNLGYDRDLEVFGLIGTAEFVFSKNVKDVRYENLNLHAGGHAGIDGRPFFTRKVNTAISGCDLPDQHRSGRHVEHRVQGAIGRSATASS